MRTFIAVELPAQFEGEVAAVARQLSSVIEARYIPRENHHVTLARHADIPNTALPQLLFPQETLAHKVTVFKSALSKEGTIFPIAVLKCEPVTRTSP